ncbi:related to nuclear localization protein NPL6 [Cephalotrichum gorgonifer]|uniref:Related to nuclear localization protein NPL6 n=1 Tax=Cephalotrichum gorgonifer TaxID=2041049 RepID=A0AAE8MQM7_9PEZI|nr:related to nuclear localization protein NPL6 [Cephalotrichum gorgonifer]
MTDASGQATAPNLAQTMPSQTPQSHNTALSGQAANTYAPAPAPAPAPAKTTPTKTTLKALPTVRDHTTDQLNAAGDEYIPRETDEFGEKKVMPNGQLLGGREYRCRTFLVPNRGDKLFMLATECARVLGYRDSYLLFNKNRSLYKIIASQVEKDDLVSQEILPFSYRSRQIAIVTARSMFRQFGSRVIVNGRRVRDDYWETKARKQGFTESDLAGEKRPGGARAREAAAAAEAQNSVMMGGPHGEIVYSTNPAPFPGAQPQLVQPDLSDTRTRDYSSILKGGPRQEITGPAYQDQTRPSGVTELNAQAHHTAEFNRSINQQREMRNDYLHNVWRRPHEQPATTNLTPPAPPPETTSTTRATQSPHTTAAGLPQSGVMATQSPQMMMAAPAYSQSIHPQSTISQAPIRGMTQQPSAQKNARPASSISPAATGNLPQAQGYNYQSSQMWPPTPQATQHGYAGYTTQAQPAHAQQSPAPQLRQHSSAGQMQPGMQFSSIPGMNQGYGATGQPLYPADQTPRQYLPQAAQGTPAVSQTWSNQQTPAAQQWWGNPQQQ